MIRKKNRGRGGVLLLKREKFSENSSIIKKNSSRKLQVFSAIPSCNFNKQTTTKRREKKEIKHVTDLTGTEHYY